MSSNFAEALRRANQATRAGDAAGATRIIQDALAGRPGGDADSRPQTAQTMRSRSPIEADAGVVERPASAGDSAATARISPRRRYSLGEVVRTLRQASRARAKSMAGMRVGTAEPPVAEGAAFQRRSFACAAGSRDYRLYVPSDANEGVAGLVVMLHGCTQSPEDFAAGAAMNALAEEQRLIVAYPAQTGRHNGQSCWNWFEPKNQRREAGEPAIIAGIARELQAEFGLGRQQSYIAGLSAGGAMAAVMGAAYPDVFAAIGVHSGLAAGSARDVMSAFAAMRGDGGVASAATSSGEGVRTIIFHGRADTTVNPANAARIVTAHTVPGATPTTESGSTGGRGYTRTTTGDVECWLIDGLGHAWSGGDPAGSYTDPAGPQASAEMLRFFQDRDHRRV